MTTSTPSDGPRQEAIFQVVARAPVCFALCAGFAAASLYVGAVSAWLLAAFVAVGVVGAGLVLLSLKYYHFWLSWLFWAVPIPAALAGLVADSMQDGSMKFMQAL